MQIDPHAWLLTIPLALGLIRFQSLPGDHYARRFVHELKQREALAWQWLGCSVQPLDLMQKSRLGGLFFKCAVALLCIGSVASLMAFVMQPSPL